MKKNKSSNEYYVKPEDIKKTPFYLSVFCFILAIASVYFTFIIYYIGLALSVFTLIISIFILKKDKNLAVISAITISIVTFLISLFILLVNFLVY